MAEINSILLVDDEPDIRTIAEMSLSQVGGWKTMLASSGAQALELATANKPDVILLDVMMPEMDGVATFKALAAMAETRNIPVIFMTAKVQSHEKERYVGFGAAGVIPKPFDPMQLPKEIRNILDQPVEQRGRNRLAALRRRYSEGLGSKIDGLRAAIEHAHAADEDKRKAAVDAAHRIAHTLHGTAGTYGHAEVSRAMAEIELALERLLEDEVENEDECWRLVEVNLERATREID
ncbi:Response regulator SaeR [Enhygromyxa salina]|uniref:Response regulator SaeR n=1 Tax=Enhygromyxa salina TaxID=215803 RepID=A0A2S9XXV3_9BACT|nr:response regulator [Enhygromyxa salina]PRP97699.1 Response regulator SaeR [Enhygromyxa salina]